MLDVQICGACGRALYACTCHPEPTPDQHRIAELEAQLAEADRALIRLHTATPTNMGYADALLAELPVIKAAGEREVQRTK